MELKVTTYGELEERVDSFFDGVLDLLVIRGPTSTGKTYHIRERTSNGEGTYLNGSLSPLETYKTLYHSMDVPIVLDDMEELMRSRRRRTILKNLADTYEVKTLSWRSSTPRLEGVPETFNTTSNVCIVCNELNTKGLNEEALVSRGLVLDFWPSDEELADRMEIVAKEYECGLSLDERYEVFRFIREWMPFSSEANLRTLVIGLRLRDGGRDWRDTLTRGMDVDVRLVLVKDLLAEHDRVGDAAAAFAEETGLTVRTFYNLKKKLEIGG